MVALGWQAKSLLRPPRQATAPAPVRAKVPPAPPVKTIQITDPATAESTTDQSAEELASLTESADSSESTTTEQTSLKEMTSDSVAIPAEGTQVAEVATAMDSDTKEQKTTDPAGKTIEEKASNQAPAPVVNQDQSTLSQTDSTAESGLENTAQSQPAPEPLPSQPTPPEQVLSAKTDKAKPAPQQIDSDPPPTPTPTPQTPYAVQIGAFRNKAYAVELVAKLAQKGYEPYIFEITGANQKLWYAVRFGHFETRDQAVQALYEFKEKENMDGIISRSDFL